MYKRKHLNGVSISTYGTQGLGEAFISGEQEIGMTVNGKKRSGKTQLVKLVIQNKKEKEYTRTKT